MHAPEAQPPLPPHPHPVFGDYDVKSDYMAGVTGVDVTPTIENVEVNPTMKEVDVTSTI